MMKRGIIQACTNFFRKQEERGFKSLLKITLSSKALYTVPAFFISLATQQDIKPNAKLYEHYNIPSTTERYSNPEITVSKKVLRDVFLSKAITVQHLADLLGVPLDELQTSLSNLALPRGANEMVSIDDAELVAYEYDCKVLGEQKEYDQLPIRNPIVTIMGHVDHGKTTLLDSLRNSNIAEGEFGAITQKIGAFHVNTQDGNRITFIDTPGHEAFVNMRIRGGTCTDLIILVVSAVEGIQPQTLEVLNIARKWKVPVIVAVNKIDVVGANPEAVEESLYKAGLAIETKGGNVPVIHISAKMKKNLDLLEELICFEAELMNLRADDEAMAEGLVLESRKETEGDSRACTIVVQNGTLKINDWVVIGDDFFKVKQIKDDRNQILNEAGPSFAVEISGLKESPESGEPFFVVESEKKAKLIAKRRAIRIQKKKESKDNISGSASKIKLNSLRDRRKFHSGNQDFIKEKFSEREKELIEKIELLKEDENKANELKKMEDVLAQHLMYMKEMVERNTSSKKQLNLILKTGDKGMEEALLAQVYKLANQHENDIEIRIVSSDIGQISESDIKEAKLFKATILGMDVTTSPEAAKLLKQENVDLKLHRIIYALLDDIKFLIEDVLNDGKILKTEKGRGKIMEIFELKNSKIGQRKIAGIQILKGKFSKRYKYSVMRDNKIIKDDLELATLKHFKNDVQEVKKGEECGLSFFDFEGIEKGDVIEAFETKLVEKKFQKDT